MNAGLYRSDAGIRFVWSFLLAVQNLTRIPVGKIPFDPVMFGRGTAFFPLVGLLVGGVLTGIYYGADLLWPPSVVAALLVAGNLLLTGGMHVDGFIDTVDGLGGKDAARRLEIMRDSRVGAFGVMGAFALLLLRFALFQSLLGAAAWRAILLAPVVSRWGVVWAVILFPYARPQGQGRLYKDHTTWREAILATVLALAISFGFGDLAGCCLVAFSFLVVLLLGWFFRRRLGGLTGDTYGAINEVLEVLVLAGGCFFW